LLAIFSTSLQIAYAVRECFGRWFGKVQRRCASRACQCSTVRGDTSNNSRQHTDMIVRTDKGNKTGYEIQLSAIATSSVGRRTRIARTNGPIPLRLVNGENVIRL
jgi:hypothetical protein